MNATRKKQTVSRPDFELSDEDKDHIRGVFLEEIVPKLARLHARVGAISCEFAGTQYQKWMIHFNSRGSDFQILDFAYDEEGCAIDLDL